MNDRLLLKGALAEKKERRFGLAARAAGIISGLRRLVVPAAVTPLAELHTAEIVALSEDLHAVRAEYMRFGAEMEELEQELGP